MNDTTDRLVELTEGYIEGRLAAAERDELHGLLRASPRNAARFDEALHLSTLLGELHRGTSFFEATTNRALLDMAPGRPRAAAPPRPRIRLRPVRPARRWWITALAACLLVGLGVLVSRQLDLARRGAPDGQMASLAAVWGEVSVGRAGADSPARVPQPLLPGDAIRTRGPHARAELEFEDATRIELRGDTAVVLGLTPPLVGRRQVAPRNRVALEAGAVQARVAARKPGEPFLIATRDAEVFVVGTAFSIEVLPEATRLEMTDGQVEAVCRRNGRTETLSAGFHAVIGPTIIVARNRADTPAGPVSLPRPIALYEFREGQGRLVHDSAPTSPPLNLEIADSNAVRWPAGGGLAVLRPTLIGSGRPATKLAEACLRSHELTVEVWLAPAYVAQPVADITANYYPLRIVSMSSGTSKQNFLVGQGLLNEASSYMCRLRTTASAPDALMANVYTPLNVVRTELTHLILTHARAGALAIYVNGTSQEVTVHEPDMPGTPCTSLAGDFSNWDPTMPLTLANESTANRPWLGTLFRVALYDRALDASQATRLFEAGPGHSKMAGNR